MGQQVEGDERGRRRLGQLADALLGRVDALGQRVEVEPVGAGDDDLAVEHAARRAARAGAPRRARGSSASAASRCGCPARRRRRRGRRCSGSRPTWARRTGPRRAGSSRVSLASMGATGGRTGRVTPPASCARGPGQQVVGRPRLTIRSAGTPAATALRQPRPSQSSWPGAWASVSMAKEQPSSTAWRRRSSGGSWRSGRELISTAVPVRAQAANTASASKVDCGRPRPVMRRPVQWPRMSVCGLSMAASMRAGHLAARPCAASSARWPRRRRARPSRSRSRSSEPSSRMSTSMPVRMRNGASCSFSSASTSSCATQALLVEAVRHREAGAVVGEHEVLAAEGAGRLGHLEDGAAAVGPVGVRVAVAAERARAAPRPARRARGRRATSSSLVR